MHRKENWPGVKFRRYRIGYYSFFGVNSKTLVKYLYISLIALCSFSAMAQKNTNSLEFVENKGQWDKSVTYMSELGNGAFFLQKNGFTVLQHKSEDLNKISESMHGHNDLNAESRHQGADGMSSGGTTSTGNPQNPSAAIILHSHAYSMKLEGTNENAEIAGSKPQAGYNNYFLGNDASKWASNCRIFNTVTYTNIYPNIDVRYFTDEGWVKYEFIIHPGGDPSKIVMRYEGADKLSVNKGELVVKTSVGEIREMQPYTYQQSEKGRTTVNAKYKVSGNTVRFSVGNFDRNTMLVIDPTLIFATFTGSRADNWGYTATYGGDGSLYSGGIVFGDGFPTSTGAFQSNFSASAGASGFNMGIMKFNPTGTLRDYATYIGGGGSDQPHSLIVNNRGNLIVAGRTESKDYPSLNQFGTLDQWDIVLTELNATGTALVGSIRIGGEDGDGINTGDSHTGGPRDLLNFYGDDARSEVMLDNAGNVYLASCTQSKNFYTTANAPFKSLSGSQDGVLIKTTPDLGTILMSTYFGGSGMDAGFVIGVSETNGDIWVCGSTTSTDFPGNKAGTIGSTYNGGRSDGYVAIFSNDGSTLKKSTYLGTSAADAVLGFEFDKFGDPYVMGTTFGTWPIINAVYGTANAKQFVGKLKPDLSAWQYTTTFGSAGALPNISPVAFLVDRCQNLYVSGWGGTTLGNYQMKGTNGMDVTADALKKTSDNNDFYFIVIKRNAAELLYGSFFGQNGNFSEHVDGGTSRFDQNGVIYQAMCANCYTGAGGPRPRFPITPGAWCCSNKYSGANGTGNGAECNLAAVKISLNFAGVGAGPSSFIDGVRDTSGCVPLTVKLIDTIQNAQSYIWNFGDGTPDFATTNFEVEHVYNSIGLFDVRLISIDSNSCNIRDTAYLNIRVRSDAATIDFGATKLPPCESLTFRFDNLSVPPASKPFTDTAFLWNFGDGTTVVGGKNSITHSYASAGTYQVSLQLLDTLYCNDGSSVVKEFNLSPLVKAQFEVPNGCVPYTALINNTTLGGQTFTWDFGDGTTGTGKQPDKIYSVAGNYRIKLVVQDANSCNLVDSAFRDILVQDAPTAAFTFAPVTPIENTPTIFTNTSSPDAINFFWGFGDGEELETASRLPIDHQYNTSGRYDACLIAVNISGCADTLCAPVDAIVVPRLDLPNAFTPLGPAPNNQIFVRGFAIGKMKFMIFNRFGQKVFESNSIKFGWDGKYNGVVQPMDVYAYVLDVEFTDGTRATRKGDITLIR